MHSQSKDTNHILKISEALFYPIGGGEVTLLNSKALPEATVSKSTAVKTTTVQQKRQGQGQRQDILSVNPQVIEFAKTFDTHFRPYLEYKVKLFRGCQIAHC